MASMDGLRGRRDEAAADAARERLTPEDRAEMVERDAAAFPADPRHFNRPDHRFLTDADAVKFARGDASGPIADEIEADQRRALAEIDRNFIENARA